MFQVTLLQDGLTLFGGILLEAIPFLLLGVFLSSLASVFIKTESFLKFFGKGRLRPIITAAGLGFLFPVCECGNIPLARRFIQKKLHPAVALTFLLAAPAFNPVVIFSTWAAFRDQPAMIFLRVIFTVVIAVLIGLVMSFHPQPEEMVVIKDQDKSDNHHNSSSQSAIPAWRLITKGMTEEFFEMLGVLIIGALIATIIQLVVPREVLFSLGQGPVFAIGIMLFFAFIISVCSTVDAFIALSYSTLFAPSALLAFLVFGPMVDIKTLVMLRKVFTLPTIIIITLLAALLTFLFSLLVSPYFL